MHAFRGQIFLKACKRETTKESTTVEGAAHILLYCTHCFPFTEAFAIFPLKSSNLSGSGICCKSDKIGVCWGGGGGRAGVFVLRERSH